jgi:ectoine hydroxylase-related dioxygenase (phytanoyl-CoA dioxygenase family)
MTVAAHELAVRLPVGTLVSNGYPLSLAPQRLGWLQPTDPSLAIEELRSRFGAQGYLWLKGVLPRDEILAFRRHFFTSLAETGLLKPGTDPGEGLYAGHNDQPQLVHSIHMALARSAEYAAFCASPAIVRFYEAFLGGSVRLLRRKIIRYTLPGSASCTAGHYDLIYLRAGTDRVCSSWIPLGDIPVEAGGLCYLEGSAAVGRRLEAEFSRSSAELPPEERINAYNRNMEAGGWVAKDLASLAERYDSRWLIADYAAGDMVIHSPYLLHASTANVDPQGRIRLSTDIRYLLAADEADPRWSNEWFSGDKL